MKRSSWAMIAIALSMVAVAGWIVLASGSALPRDLFRLVPPDAEAVLRVRVQRVLRSEAWQKLVVELGGTRGIDRVRGECGFNPLAQIEELMVFARPAPGDGAPKVAFVARGPLRKTALIDCVQKFTGKGLSGFEQRKLGGTFALCSARSTTCAAFVGSRGLLAGDAETMTMMLSALDDPAPRSESAARLRRLWQTTQPEAELALAHTAPAAALAYMGLDRATVEALVDSLPPLTGVAGHLRLARASVAGRARLLTEDEAGALKVVALARGVQSRLLALPGVRLTPAGALLRDVEMRSQDRQAVFEGSVELATARLLMELLPGLSKLRRSLARADRTPAAAHRSSGRGEAPEADAGASPTADAAAPPSRVPGRAPPNNPAE